MVVISKAILLEFGIKHADAIEPLNRWYQETKKANWKKFNDVKSTFGSVDAVGNDRYVFNIKGNDYRMVAMIFFDIRTVFIRFIGTHSEYNKIDCSKV
jgi:mRNA interferase HigB